MSADLDAPVRVLLSPMAQRVLAMMRPGQKYSALEVAAILDISDSFAGTHLARMAARGDLVRLGTRRQYRYALPPHAPGLIFQPRQMAHSEEVAP